MTSLRDIADKRDVIGDSLNDVTRGVVIAAVAACALMLTTQLVETGLLRLVALSWKRRQRCHDDDDDNDGVSRPHHQQQCVSDDWRSTTYAQFDDVIDTCSPQRRHVTMFDLSSGFAETNV